MSRLRTAYHFARGAARWGIPERALLFGPHSLGDDLLCTAVLREARRRGRPFAMMTRRPELFVDNSDPAEIIPIDDRYVAGLRLLGRPVVQPYYTPADPANPDRLLAPPRPIIAEMCRLAGLTGDVALRPYLFPTAAERAAGALHPRQVAIQSTCLTAALPIPTKEWGADRMADVARRLAGQFHLVQLGAAADPALPVAQDLRGRTSLREAAAILAASRLFIGLEGFLTHLARAVDCPSVVVIGGRWTPLTAAYDCNRNLSATVPCSPCGLSQGCPHGMACMTMLPPDAVAAAALELAAAAPLRPLPATNWNLHEPS